MIPLTNSRFRNNSRGFSLVEVALALGIVSFALLPIIALLPAGLTNYRGSVSRVEAAEALSSIATCIQLATANPGTPSTYTALAPCNGGDSGSPLDIAWSPGSSLKQYGPIYLDENGTPITSGAGIPSNARLTAMITVTPPNLTAPSTVGSAYIYIGWPAQSTPGWNGNLVKNPTEQGHEEVTIPLNPGTP